MAIAALVKENNSRYSHNRQKKIENPHDKFFKETFGHVEVTKSFLQHYLPPQVRTSIDIDTLKPEKDSYINEDLEEGFSDLLFSVKMEGAKGYIYLLFEHKSYSDKTTVFQVLKYMAEIWTTKMKKENMNQVPMIIPLVIYHGASQWKMGNTLGGFISSYDDLPSTLHSFIPNYIYLLYDISSFTDEEIRGEARIRIIFTMFRDVKHAHNIEQVLEIIDKAITYLKELDHKRTGIAYFETFMRYIVSATKNLTTADTEKIVRKIETDYAEGSEVIMTLADIWREEGIKEGIKEGKKEGIKEVAKNMLVNEVDIGTICKFTGLTRNEVEKIKKEIQQ